MIIGEGLKKLRKASKEKKMMMKYLPGDRRINAAKKDIAKDWKIEFQKGFGTTHKKLEKLAADKAKEVENVVKTDVKEPQMFQNKYKKQVVNINLRSNQESAYGNLKELISQLDKMINYVQSDVSPTVHSIPIYSKVRLNLMFRSSHIFGFWYFGHFSCVIFFPFFLSCPSCLAKCIQRLRNFCNIVVKNHQKPKMG